MPSLETRPATLPDSCRNLRMNLSGVPRQCSLAPAQARAAVPTSAPFCRHPERTRFLVAFRHQEPGAADCEDAGGAALGGLTTGYPRYRHLTGNPDCGKVYADLRMNRGVVPANKVRFKPCATGCAALAGCESCLRGHDAGLPKDGVTEKQIHDGVRIVAFVSGYRSPSGCTHDPS